MNKFDTLPGMADELLDLVNDKDEVVDAKWVKVTQLSESSRQNYYLFKITLMIKAVTFDDVEF